MNDKKVCCFSGHRKLPAAKMEHSMRRLDREIDRLISEGVSDFVSGGAQGFDQLAAALVVAKRDAGARVRLIFLLPCRNQDAYWRGAERRQYHNLLERADELVYISDAYDSGCMKRRNFAMVERADVCVCALFTE